MADVHVTVQSIDKSSNQVVFDNPNNGAGTPPVNATDTPAPPKSGTQVSGKVVSSVPNVVVRYSNPA